MTDKLLTVSNENGLQPHAAELCERVRRYEDDADPYIQGLIAARVYRDNPDMPVVLKRAEIIARVLEQAPVNVLPEEKITGLVWRRRRVHPGVGDPDWWRVSIAYPDKAGFNPDWPAPAQVLEELSFWKDNTQTIDNLKRKEYSWMQKYAVAGPHGQVQGHTLPDHGILLGKGIDGLRSDIRGRLKQKVTDGQKDQLKAMDRCLEGLSAHALRCAEAVQTEAGRGDDPFLSENLEALADDCRFIAGNAPVTFRQALQLLKFSNTADVAGTRGDACSFGRVDQLLYPCYRSDIESGRITEDEAFDLVCHFFAKCWADQPSNNMTVGGLTPEGESAVNELSYMFLEALEATELVCDLSVRLSRRDTADFRRVVSRVVRRGFGRPSLYNDDITVPALIKKGVKETDANSYAPLGCVEVMIPGKDSFRTMGFSLNLPKILELVLNRGTCLVTGDTVWDDVPDDFPVYEELHAEYRKRIRETVELAVEVIREDERLEHTVFPRPWLTTLSHGGIEDAVDMTAGQPEYDHVGVTLCGIADIVNSLAAVKHLVYEKKEITLAELRTVLENDWEGSEQLRSRILRSLPRFGMDDPETNKTAREEAAWYASCFENHRTEYGDRFLPMIFGVGTSLLYYRGPKTGASASGRRSGSMLSMSLQPSTEGRQGCLTEVLRSAASIDFLDFAGGVSNVQECDPTHFEGEQGLERLESMIRGYFNMGGMELSLNFLDEEKMREAQKNPEKYQGLMVRLFGLSARFVNLSETLQESVIERVSAASSR